MKIQTYQIYFTTIYIGKRSKASRCEAPKSFYANLLGFLADSSGVGSQWVPDFSPKKKNGK